MASSRKRRLDSPKFTNQVQHFLYKVFAMGQRYAQFSLEERCTLSRLKQAGKTVRQIAAAMDRAPSTISPRT